MYERPKANTGNATFSFAEALERIALAEDGETLNELKQVIVEERKRYALFYLRVILAALAIRREQIENKL